MTNWGRDATSPLRAPDCPMNAIAAHNAKDVLSNLSFQHVAPGVKRKLARLLVEREPSAGKIDMLFEDALDVLARHGFGEGQC